MSLIPILIKRYIGEKPEEITTETYDVSELLPSNFIESKLDLNSYSVGDDAWFYIQDKLNRSRSDLKIIINFDKKVAISDTLRLGSNTELNFNAGCGIILRNQVSKSILKNRNIIPSNNLNIVDTNIRINGGIFNGNGAQQKRGVRGHGMAAIFSWHGVLNLEINDFKIYNYIIYAQIATNIVNGLATNFVVDKGNTTGNNQDGMHWDGWCTNCSFINGVIRSGDDAIAINADDGYTKWQNSSLNGEMFMDFYTSDFNGPANNIHIENIQINNGDGLGWGIRILSTISRVDNITIKNIRGITVGYGLLVDTYSWSPAMDFPGKGNIGSIIADNLSFNTTTDGYKDSRFSAKISTTCSIEKFIVTNATQNTLNAPQLIRNVKDANGFNLNYGEYSVNGIDY